MDFLMFAQIFLSPQVKRNVIISNKRGTRHAERISTCDFKKLGNIPTAISPLGGPRRPHKKQENIKKISKAHRIMAQYSVSPPKNENFVYINKKLLKNGN